MLNVAQRMDDTTTRADGPSDDRQEGVAYMSDEAFLRAAARVVAENAETFELLESR